jgi:hypothetical protein
MEMTMLKRLFNYLWKLPLCGVAFLIGLVLSGAVLPLLALESPAIPEGTDPNTILLWFLLGSLILAFALSFISRGLRGGFLVRWLTMGVMAWAIGAVGMVLEAYFFMTTGAVSSAGSALFTVLNFLLPSFALAAMVALLFRPGDRGEVFVANVGSFFRARTIQEWSWRVLAVIVAFPVIYITFGELVLPLVGEYYVQGAYELALPSWSQIIPLQLARSVLFLLVCLPVLAMWRGSRRSLVLSLGFATSILVGFMSVITSYWFPWQMRLFHGLEILADSFVYAWVLVALLIQRRESVPF